MAGLPLPRQGLALTAATSACVWLRSSRASRPLWTWTVGTICAMLLASISSPSARAEAIQPATSSRAARDESLRSMPFDKLTPEARAKINAVVRKPTLFRRMPLSLTYGDPNLHQFLIRNPEVVVNIWQLMGVTKVSLERKDQFAFAAADGMGTVADVELVYGDQQKHLYFCRGKYEGSLYPKPITGDCVLLLETGSVDQKDGTHQIVDRLDVFLNVDNVGVDVLTKTLQPLVVKSADQNFIETVRFVERVWRTAEKHGPAIGNLAARLDQVSPERREQFVQVAVAAHEAARAHDGQPATAQQPSSEPARHTPQLRR
ncbi:MAG: hypothetical protein U0795_05080 [Pirellulales bacterium]